jgi:hypothetical protein
VILNMSKIMAKMRTWHAQIKPLLVAPVAHQPDPGRRLPRQFDFSAGPTSGRVGGFGVHGSTGGATGAGLGLLCFESRALRPPEFRL